MSFFKDGKDYDQKLTAIKGRIFSDETRAKIRAAKLGKKHSDEHRAKIRAGKLGHKHSEETKAKMRARGVKYGVKCHTPDGIFDSISLTAKHYDISRKTVACRMYGKSSDKWRDWYIVE